MPEIENLDDMSSHYELMSEMDNDLLAFFAGVGFLVIYLIFSGLTEMGTKLPWKK